MLGHNSDGILNTRLMFIYLFIYENWFLQIRPQLFRASNTLTLSNYPSVMGKQIFSPSFGFPVYEVSLNLGE